LNRNEINHTSADTPHGSAERTFNIDFQWMIDVVWWKFIVCTINFGTTFNHCELSAVSAFIERTSGNKTQDYFSMTGHLHILVIKLRLTWISVTAIGGLIVLSQRRGHRDLRTSLVWFPFMGEVAHNSGTLASDYKCCCLYMRTSWNDATGSRLLFEPRKAVHWKRRRIFWVAADLRFISQNVPLKSRD
jgi:hypothetical protein